MGDQYILNNQNPKNKILYYNRSKKGVLEGNADPQSQISLIKSPKNDLKKGRTRVSVFYRFLSLFLEYNFNSPLARARVSCRYSRGSPKDLFTDKQSRCPNQ